MPCDCGKVLRWWFMQQPGSCLVRPSPALTLRRALFQEEHPWLLSWLVCCLPWSNKLNAMDFHHSARTKGSCPCQILDRHRQPGRLPTGPGIGNTTISYVRYLASSWCLQMGTPGSPTTIQPCTRLTTRYQSSCYYHPWMVRDGLALARSGSHE